MQRLSASLEDKSQKAGNSLAQDEELKVTKKKKEKRKIQTKKVILSIAVILMLSMLTQPTYAWVYHDNPVDDGLYERFGPQADRLLISLYANDNSEFDALAAGQLDLTDGPIPKTRYDAWTTAPLNESIQVVSYGPEYGLFILDMNSNNNQYLGNPPDPTYTNPVYPNPMSVAGLRRAIAYLVNRDEYLADPSIGAGFGYPMYTTMPPAQAKYVLDVTEYPEMPWAYTYSRDAANAMLDASGFAERDGDGFRKWNVTGTTAVLKFYIRSDHPGRNMIGTKLLAELAAVGLKATPYFGSNSFCSLPVMYQKDFHLYTGDWALDVDPDFLINWSWDYYWHPGFCYNYGGHNDSEFNDAALGIMYANTQAEAVEMALVAQYRQAYLVLGVPLYCVAGNKAYHKTYVGNDVGEEGYFGKNWVGVKNVVGYGIDNGWSLMNMWPFGTEVMGNCAMTIRWGFKVPEIKQLNPIYASSPNDWNLLNQIYERLIVRNASDVGQFLPWLAKAFKVDLYEHPVYGAVTKVRFSMGSDATWQDGTPITAYDVYFTYVELKSILIGRGLPYPWWWSSVQNILSFSILDPYNFEVLLDVKSIWALSWISRVPLLPAHIWKPIAETGDPLAFQPDPDLIGSGPWRFGEYVPGSYVLLHANTPGSVVHGITSPQGYSRFVPAITELNVMTPELEYRNKIPPGENVTFGHSLIPLWQNGTTYDINITVFVVPYVGDPWSLTISEGVWPMALNYPAGWNCRDAWRCIFTQYRLDHFRGFFFSAGVAGGFVIGQDTLTVVRTTGIYGVGNLRILIAKGDHMQEAFNVEIGGASITIVERIIVGGIIRWRSNISTSLLENTSLLETWYPTIKEDIAGSTLYDDIGLPDYPYKRQLRSPDFCVDYKDIAEAARAFGAVPGYPRWSCIADLNGDAIIDYRDINAIARKFGWAG